MDAIERLYRAGPPSTHAVASGNRRDIVAEDEFRLRVEGEAAQLRYEIALKIACLARRLRRELHMKII